MFKGQKHWPHWPYISAIHCTCFAADEGSGEIHFKGEVIEAPCEIHPG